MSQFRFILAIRHSTPGADAGTIEIVDDPKTIAHAGSALWTNSPSRIGRLSGGSGLIIGSTFLRDGFRQVRGEIGCGPGVARAIAAHLVRNCWGSYLAVIYDASDRSVSLMRDPTGNLPVYRTALPGFSIFASDVGILVDAGVLDAVVSWDAIHEHLRSPELRRARTCLAGVDELSPGMLCLSSDDGTEGGQIWAPWAFTSPRTIPRFDDASEILRFNVQKSLAAWGSAAGKIVVPVSGGLDSSIVCAALASEGIDFACVTIATRDPSGDERRYARQLADHFAVQLIEQEYDITSIDPDRSAASHLPRPVMKPFAQATRRAFLEAADDVGAQAIFDGNGGDNIFCFLHSSSPVADRLRREGISIGVLRTLADMSRITGCTIPALAKMALKHTWTRRPYAWLPNDLLLNRSRYVAVQSRHLANYFSSPQERQYGKLAHVALILAIQNFVEGYERSGTTGLFSPLLSQPIVETCLAIPTWHWCKGGINRAVARAAFKDLLPPQVISRTSKSGPDSFVHEIYRTYRTRICESLLDGLLAANDVIDRAAVERALKTEPGALGETLYRLLDFADTEAWARSWGSPTTHRTSFRTDGSIMASQRSLSA